jgi:hypothetical protein
MEKAERKGLLVFILVVALVITALLLTIDHCPLLAYILRSLEGIKG